MGIFKNVFKKVALAAVVIAGKRILSKVVTDVMDSGKQPPEEKAVTVTAKPKTASVNRRRATKPRGTGSKTAAIAQKEAEATADDKPKKPAKPRTRKPRAAKPKVTETKPADAESKVDTVTEQQSAATKTTSSPEADGASEASNR